MGFFRNLFGAGKPRLVAAPDEVARQREARKTSVRTRLINHAFEMLNNGHPGWNGAGARVYGGALAHSVPLFVELLVFGDAAPPALRETWKASDIVIDSLAGFISWRLACSSFSNLAEDDENGRNMLMDITGTLFPTPHIEDEKRWYALVKDPSPLLGSYLTEDADVAAIYRNVDAFMLADILGISNLPISADLPDVSERNRDSRALCIVYILTIRGEMFKAYRDLCKPTVRESLDFHDADIYKDFPNLVEKELRVHDLIRKENRATAELSAALVEVYNTYYACAEAYLRRGDYSQFIQSLSLGADYYSFAANNYYALGDPSSARDSLRIGKERIEAALSHPGSSAYEVDIARAKLSEDLRAIDAMLQKVANN